MSYWENHNNINDSQGYVKTSIIVFYILLVNLVVSQETILKFPSWEEGVMEIHHINTGRGDVAFFVFPDATTLLVDAGDTSEAHARVLSARNAPLTPNRSKTAPEWIVDYIQQFFPINHPIQLDYAMITHYHDDHFGELDPHRKIHKGGNYALTGLMEVGSHLPIKMMLDRGSSFPVDLKDSQVQKKLNDDDEYGMIPTLKHYWRYIDYHAKKNDLLHQTLEAGVNNQIVLKKKPQKYPKFSVRNIAVNGQIWTGIGEDYYNLFAEGEYPGENPLSTCIKISYGEFDYFTGGDISGINAVGGTNLNSMESNIAPVVGAVDVATLNHHGNRDSQNAYYVRTIRPRVWIQQNWSSDHPGEEVLRRITSTDLYPMKRDIFSTVMLQANKDVIGGRVNTYKSQEGHIVVRVYNSGDNYEIYILNDKSEKREVLAKFGPYTSL